MNYTVGIGVVLLLQLAITSATIFAGTGNGSFVGLAAMLFALYGIPGTAIVNFLLIRSHRKELRWSNVVLLVLISSILPVLQLALLIAQLVLDL